MIAAIFIAQPTVSIAAPRNSQRGETALVVLKDFAGVVLVAKGRRVLLNRAYGTTGGHPLTKDSRFWIASAGKQFAAAAVMKLVDERRLRLDDTLGRLFANVPADKANITVLQLLSHTSGFGQSYVSEEQSNRQTAVNRILAEPLQGAPGDKFRYSNNNIQLAAAIVEQLSRQTYQSFVEHQLWRHAGLRNSGFAGSAGASLVTPVAGDLPSRLKHAYWGEQGVYSTAGDLYGWYRALAGGAVLKPATVKRMFTPVAEIAEGYSTPGWFRGTTGRGNDFVFVRGNEDFGANSLVYIYPVSDTVIIVLTHAGDATDDLSWSRAVQRSLEEQLKL